jgi:hypothetical protein
VRAVNVQLDANADVEGSPVRTLDGAGTMTAPSHPRDANVPEAEAAGDALVTRSVARKRPRAKAHLQIVRAMPELYASEKTVKGDDETQQTGQQ